MITFRVTLDGHIHYFGLFAHAIDAIADGLDRGARSVAVRRA
ncbi:hypothetical protein [Cupriavidus pinatubonensis]|nr:hypothetical protein [Cupriavidus pinatubonensis]